VLYTNGQSNKKIIDMYFSSNIKFLRKRLNLTQDEVADDLQMKRPTLSGYENNVSLPTIKALVAFSNYFHVSIDTLIKIDLRNLSNGQVSMITEGEDPYIKGSKLRVLATTISPENIDNIELIPEKAKAGYATGFADPEYIKMLPTFQLPFLNKERKYRTFQISGDSMLPIPDGAFVTGEYIEDWTWIRNRQAYILLTLNDGIVFKVVENRVEEERKLILHSLNPAYEPYELHINEIKEVWKFVNFISNEMPGKNYQQGEVSDQISDLRHEIDNIKLELKKRKNRKRP
jgi:transcriptional regulator with XRE-family HTH domain